MPRSVKEWIGKTDNAKIPPRVRLRIFEREKGICHICEQPIRAGQTWEANHDPALINGGENRESMIFPAHVKCHQEHTAEAAAEKSKVAKKRKKHLGVSRSKQTIKSRGFAPEENSSKREPKPSLPPRPLYVEASRSDQQ